LEKNKEPQVVLKYKSAMPMQTAFSRVATRDAMKNEMFGS
jgi:hypothetical protein